MEKIHVPFSELKCNCIVKTYPDGSKSYLVADSYRFVPPGWEASRPVSHSGTGVSDNTVSTFVRSSARARARVKDYALSTLSLDLFVTLTLDKDKVDRYDLPSFMKPFKNWLDNSVRRKGLIYILVPEHHKDGAVHFHGLINSGAFNLVDSGTFSFSDFKKPRKPRSERQRLDWLSKPDDFHQVWNIPEWKFGFTTGIFLYGERAAAVSYVLKYIGKECDKIGGRYYYSGGALQLPKRDYICFNGDIPSNAYSFSAGGNRFSVWIE